MYSDASNSGILKKDSAVNTANALMNALTTGSSVLTANDYIITQYASGGTTYTTYHRRPASAVRVGGLTTARKLTIGSSGKNFDGTADVSWTLTEIGAAAASHEHGNITSTGTLGTASRIVVTDSNKKVTTASYAHLNTSAGTASANGYDELVLGNSTASGTAGNTFGRIALYSTSTTGQYIIAAGTG